MSAHLHRKRFWFIIVSQNKVIGHQGPVSIVYNQTVKISLCIHDTKSPSLPMISPSLKTHVNVKKKPHPTKQLPENLEVHPVHNVPAVSSIWENDEEAGEANKTMLPAKRT